MNEALENELFQVRERLKIYQEARVLSKRVVDLLERLPEGEKFHPLNTNAEMVHGSIRSSCGAMLIREQEILETPEE